MDGPPPPGPETEVAMEATDTPPNEPLDKPLDGPSPEPERSFFPRPRVVSDGSDGVTIQFIHHNKEMWVKKGQDKIPTHLLLNGGTISVPYGTKKNEAALSPEFFQRLSQDYRNETMPPIVCVRTCVFRFYADFDLKIPCQQLPDEAVRKMTLLMNAQAQRFFPDDHPPLTCIVCTKSHPPNAPDQTVASEAMAAAIGVPAALYKHGLHFHWPNLYVKQEHALQMRMSMMAVLERVDWTDTLGVYTVDWDNVFDESVYGTSEKSVSGLRIVGAPKASKCPDCKNDNEHKKSCGTCFRRGHVIDPVHYKMFEAYDGQNLNEARTSRLRANFLHLLQETDIRSSDPDRSEISSGWKVYPGCPPLRDKDGRSRKRKATSDTEGVERKFTRNPEVRDAEKERVVRKYLTKLSPHYANSTVRILYEERKESELKKDKSLPRIASYKCPLRGDGAQFCLNLKKNGGFHNGQNVWMEIVAKNVSNNEYVARMRCFCKCKTTDDRYGVPCSMFKSKEKYLDSDDVCILFGKGTTAKQQYEQMLATFNKTYK